MRFKIFLPFSSQILVQCCWCLRSPLRTSQTIELQLSGSWKRPRSSSPTIFMTYWVPSLIMSFSFMSTHLLNTSRDGDLTTALMCDQNVVVLLLPPHWWFEGSVAHAHLHQHLYITFTSLHFFCIYISLMAWVSRSIFFFIRVGFQLCDSYLASNDLSHLLVSHPHFLCSLPS